MKSPTGLPTLCKWKVQKHKDLHKETLDKHHPAAGVVDLPSEFSLAGPLEGTCDTEKMSQQSMSWQIMRCKVQALTCKELHKNALQHFLLIIGPLALSSCNEMLQSERYILCIAHKQHEKTSFYPVGIPMI